jgi:hypothetical protein
VACAAVLADQSGAPRRTPCAPLPRWLAGVLTGQGLVLAAVGTVLFAGGLTVHEGIEPASAVWPWPLTPVSAMVIGAWLLSLAAATALVVREGDLGRLRIPALTYAAFGAYQLAVLVAHRDDVTPGPQLAGYVALLAAMVVTGAYGRRASRCQWLPMVVDGRSATAGSPASTSPRSAENAEPSPESPHARTTGPSRSTTKRPSGASVHVHTCSSTTVPGRAGRSRRARSTISPVRPPSGVRSRSSSPSGRSGASRPIV